MVHLQLAKSLTTCSFVTKATGNKVGPIRWLQGGHRVSTQSVFTSLGFPLTYWCLCMAPMDGPIHTAGTCRGLMLVQAEGLNVRTLAASSGRATVNIVVVLLKGIHIGVMSSCVLKKEATLHRKTQNGLFGLNATRL